MKINEHIVLYTFQGTNFSEEDILDGENYWKLIGRKGTILKLDNENRKALILFDDNLDDLSLIHHNSIKNSLWIKWTDFKSISFDVDFVY